MRLLVVDMWPESSLVDALRAHGHEVECRASASEVAQAREDFGPETLLLGQHLEDGDGLLALRELVHIRVPLIYLLVADHGQQERILALKFGADDVIDLPIDLELLEAKMEAILRRYQRSVYTAEKSTLGGLQMWFVRFEVTVNGNPVQLTRTEYGVLKALMLNPNHVVERDQIARAVWGNEIGYIGHAIDVQVYRLRGKLRRAGLVNPKLASVRGRGYWLIVEQGEN